MTTLLTDLDLHHPLRCAAKFGASFLTESLTDAIRKILHDEISAGSFKPLPKQIGRYGVRHEAELLQIGPDRVTSYPTVARLRRDLVQLVHLHAQDIPGLTAWQPNDIAAMRYRTRSLGITPHGDNKQYRHLIAIFTIEGSTTFTHCADRDGTVLDRWQTMPGSLVLLRAPGPPGAGQTRPFHTVSGPTNGPRVSLTFRMREQTP